MMQKSCEEQILYLSTKTGFSEEDKGIIKKNLRQGVNWNLIMRLASCCNILPLMAGNLLSIDDELIPRLTLTDLLSRYEKEYTVNNLMLWEELKKILSITKEKGIALMPFKGVITCVTLYNSLGLRRTSDIDVFVKKDNLPDIEKEVTSLGYILEPKEAMNKEFQLKTYYHFLFEKKGRMGNIISLNLHWDILPSIMKIENLVRDFWTNALIYNISGEEILTLCVEDLLIESFIELYKDIVQERRFLVKRYMDISRILYLYKQQINWDNIYRRMQEYRIRPLAYFALVSVNDTSSGNIVPREAMSRLRPAFTKQFFIHRALDNLNSLNSLENYPGINRMVFYFFFSEVVLLSRWKVFFLRLFHWAYLDAWRYNKSNRLFYFIFINLCLIRQLQNKIYRYFFRKRC